MTAKVALAEDSLFSFSDYKICLNSLIERASTGERGVRSALARAMGCQPAYLSRVLNGDGELSLEQMESACRYFLLNKSESKFLLALLGENRAGTGALKAYWRELIHAARKEQEELKSRLGLEDSLTEAEIYTYYSSWHYAAIHIATSIPGLQSPGALAAYLSLTEEVVRATLEFLVRTGLVDRQEGRYETSSRDIHLERRSPMVAKHHLNWKLKSTEALSNPEANAIRYTGVVTLSAADAAKIKEIVLRATEETRGVVRSSAEEILGCYQFEFFEVGTGRKKK